MGSKKDIRVSWGIFYNKVTYLCRICRTEPGKRNGGYVMGTKKAGILNASERDGVQYRKAKTWEMIVGMANNGCAIAFYLVIGFASMIASQGYGIAVVVAGLLITGTRIFDGVTDAWFAVIFERFNPRKGKLRFFMIVGWAICCLGVLLMYNWAAGHFEGPAGVAMFLLAYIIYVIGYTFNGLGGGTVPTVITNDPTQRPMVGVIGTCYSYLVPLLFTNVTTFVILPKYDNKYNLPMLKEMVWWYVGISLIFVLIACIGVSRFDVAETFEGIKSEEKKKEKVGFKDMFGALKGNRPLQLYMITGIPDKLAQQTAGQSVITTLVNGVLIGSYAATTMVGNFSQIVGIVFAFAGGIFIAKWGSKKATSVWSWISIGISAFMIAFCFFLGGPNGMSKLGEMGWPIILWAVLNLAKGGAMMILTTAGSSMRADITDYECERSGNYMPAAATAVYSFVDKLVSSFGSTIAAIGISLVGYTTTVPQMGDKATWPIFWMGMFLMFGMPILGWLCNVVAMHFYKLDRERMIEVQKNLAARKEQAE